MKKDLEKAINNYIKAFEKKHNILAENYIHSQLGVWEMADMFINFSDIVYDLDIKCPKNLIWDWYNETLDRSIKDLQVMNYETYAKGLRYEDI